MIPRGGRGAIALALLSIVLVGVSLEGLRRGYFRDAATEIPADPAPLVTVTPPAGRIILVCLDSVRRDALLDPELAPFFGELGRRGATGDLLVPTPTLTGTSVVSFGTGTTPPLGATLSNFLVPPWTEECVVSLARRVGRPVAFFGDGTWFQAFGRSDDVHAVDSFHDFTVGVEGDWYVPDRELMPALLAHLAAPASDLVLVHFQSTDKIAHRYGAAVGTPDAAAPYARALRNLDGLVRRIAEAAGDDATILVVSDHGCSRAGTHGGYSDETARVRWAGAGPGLRSPGEDVALRSVDLAAVLCALMGVRGPRTAEGPVTAGLLAMPTPDALAIAADHLRARREFARARSPGIETPADPAAGDAPSRLEATLARHRALDAALLERCREENRGGQRRWFLLAAALVLAGGSLSDRPDRAAGVARSRPRARPRHERRLPRGGGGSRNVGLHAPRPDARPLVRLALPRLGGRDRIRTSRRPRPPPSRAALPRPPFLDPRRGGLAARLRARARTDRAVGLRTEARLVRRAREFPRRPRDHSRE
ncbi:MAG: alkaline phosphatase family protein [Planctomycetota bacterium]